LKACHILGYTGLY